MRRRGAGEIGCLAVIVLGVAAWIGFDRLERCERRLDEAEKRAKLHEGRVEAVRAELLLRLERAKPQAEVVT